MRSGSPSQMDDRKMIPAQMRQIRYLCAEAIDCKDRRIYSTILTVDVTLLFKINTISIQNQSFFQNVLFFLAQIHYGKPICILELSGRFSRENVTRPCMSRHIRK